MPGVFLQFWGLSSRHPVNRKLKQAIIMIRKFDFAGFKDGFIVYNPLVFDTYLFYNLGSFKPWPVYLKVFE